MNGRPNMMPPIIHPTKCCVQNQYSTTIVPHIHPSHTTHVNHQMYQHNHYFPHSDSMVNEVSNQHFTCPGPGPGFGPGPSPGFGPSPGPGFGPGPGPGFGPGPGPGFGPGPGPGFGPGQGPGFGPGQGPGFGPGQGPGSTPGMTSGNNMPKR